MAFGHRVPQEKPLVRLRKISLATAGYGLLLGAVLLGVFLTQSTDPPSFVTGWRIAAALVAVGSIAILHEAVTADVTPSWWAVAPAIVAGVILIDTLFRYQHDTFPLGRPSLAELLVFAIILVVFLAGRLDDIDRSSFKLPLLAAFAVVLALFLYHLTTTPVGVNSPTWPVWAVVTSAVSLVLVPRYIPLRSFLWTVSLLAAGTAALAIYARYAGAFTLWQFEIAVINQDFPFTDHDLDGWVGVTSIFNNINVFGLVTFAGVSTAAVLLHRTWRAGPTYTALVPAGLLAINGLGLMLSSSDAAWIAAAVTLGMIAVVRLLDDRAVLPAVVGGTIVGILAIAAVYLDALPIDDGGRFDRWLSGIRAMRSNPSWLGHGHIATAEFVQPYHPTGSRGTPHNSYLSMLIRTGFIGAGAYLVLLWGTILYRAYRPETIDLALLAFALGWAVHHLFESYTIVQWTPAAVLSAMTFGYLLVGDRWSDPPT